MSWLDPFNIVGGIKDSLFPDPSKGSQQYLNNLGPMYQQAYNPYIEAGQRQLPSLEEQYKMLMQNPQQLLGQLGEGYEQSPGYQFQYNQAMNGANNAAAAGGIAGTPAHQQQAAAMGGQVANQDYYNYLSKALGLYGQGLEGSQGLYNQGYGASSALAGNLGNLGLNQANLSYQGAQGQNNAFGGLLGSIFGMFSPGGSAGGMR